MRIHVAITFCPVYDQYYASLAASSAAASAQATPTATGHQSSSSSNSPDFTHDDDRDEKPNVQYLDSLNAYRKRSREPGGRWRSVEDQASEGGRTAQYQRARLRKREWTSWCQWIWTPSRKRRRCPLSTRGQQILSCMRNLRRLRNRWMILLSTVRNDLS